MRPFYFKPNIFSGLDIQADEMRLLQLQRTKLGFAGWHCAAEELPPDVIVEGRINQVAVLQKSLTRLVTKTYAKNCPTVIALPHQALMTKRIQLGVELSSPECELIIRENLRHYFPEQTPSFCFDFFRLNEQEVLVLGAGKEQLDLYLSVIQGAGLKIKIVDVEAYALARVAEFAAPVELSQQVFGVLVENSSILHYFLQKKQDILFSHQWSSNNKNGLQELKMMLAKQVAATQKRLDLLVMGTLTESSDWLRELSYENLVDIVCVDPFKKLQDNPVLGNTLPKVSGQFVMAFGLALRGFAR